MEFQINTFVKFDVVSPFNDIEYIDMIKTFLTNFKIGEDITYNYNEQEKVIKFNFRVLSSLDWFYILGCNMYLFLKNRNSFRIDEYILNEKNYSFLESSSIKSSSELSFALDTSDNDISISHLLDEYNLNFGTDIRLIRILNEGYDVAALIKLNKCTLKDLLYLGFIYGSKYEEFREKNGFIM